MAKTQWYIHDESDSLFLDEPDQWHDGLTAPFSPNEIFEWVNRNGLPAVDEDDLSLLYDQLSRGY